MKICGIYQIYNIANGKCYVGQSVDIKTRRREHFSALKYGRHYNKGLQADYTKQVAEDFEFRILETGVPEALLDARERLWISFYKSDRERFGYNRDSGGTVSRKLSLEARLKLSVANTGKKVSAETRRKISEANTGKVLSLETRKKISEANVGKRLSVETRRRMSVAKQGVAPSASARAALIEACTGRHASDDTRKKMSESHKRYWRSRRAQ